MLAAAKKLRAAQRPRRKKFENWLPSERLVPKPGAAFEGRIRPSQLLSVDDVERELSARGIEGWTARADLTGGNNGRDDSRWKSIAQLRDLLPVYDTDHPKAGFLKGGRQSEPSDEQDLSDDLTNADVEEAAIDSLDAEATAEETAVEAATEQTAAAGSEASSAAEGRPARARAPSLRRREAEGAA